MRYVGMVQDMLETEYYVSEVNGIKTHYRDALLDEEAHENDMDIAHKLAERQPLVVVPIPFSSQWLLEQPQYSSSTNAAANDVKINPSVMHECSVKNNSNKRQVQDVTDPPTKRKALSTPDTSLEDDSTMEEDATPPNTTSNAPPQSDWWPAGCMQSDPNHCPVLAKLYYEQQEEEESNRLCLNEVVELVGVLSLDPMDADFSQQQSGAMPAPDEWNDVHDFGCMTLPPPSLLPRLHVLCYNRVNLERAAPLESTGTTNVEETSNNQQDDDDDDRGFAIQVLAKHVFSGNQDAAEALLMACMSMAERQEVSQGTWVPTKTPNETTLGCASLNLVLSSQESCSKMSNRLQQILSQILPIVGSVDLSREKLGKTVVSPAKDESGRLAPQSPLQLPKGSALIINESTLTEGRIEARAEETLRVLHSLTHGHSIPYRFEGMMSYQFEADYRVIVVSKSTGGGEGSKLLPCSLTMKLPDEVLAMEDASTPVMLSEEECERIRTYLAKCRCKPNEKEVFNVPLPKALLEQAQTDFIEKRVEHRKKAEERKRMQAMAVDGAAIQLESTEPAEIGEADFHRWLTVARLEARSRIPEGSPEAVANQTWADTLRLDEAMRS